VSAPPGFVPTPPALVEAVVAGALDAVETPSPRALDPACGDGAFLVGLARALARRAGARTQRERERVVREQVRGVELDPDLADRARRALVDVVLAAGARPSQRRRVEDRLRGVVQVGCALSAALPGEADWGSPPADAPCPVASWTPAFSPALAPAAPGFDLVVGNPPYLDSAWLCAQRPRWRAWLKARFARTAQGNWDLYCPFVERALALTRPGGALSLIVPSAVAAADYAAGVRSLLAEDSALLRVVPLAEQRLFPRAVYPIYFLCRRGPPAEGSVDQAGTRLSRAAYATTWPLGPAARAVAAGLDACGDGLPLLQSPGLAVVRGAATVAEAYRLIDAVQEDPRPGPSRLRLVNSGTIDPHVSLWGTRRMRYLGRTYQFPVVEREAWAGVAPRRARDTLAPKVVVAGNTRRLEAVADPEGGLLAAKSTTLVLPADGVDPYYVAGLLNSRLASFLYRLRFGGLALSGGYLRVGPPQLRQLPMPPPSRDPRLAEEVAALARRRQHQGDASFDRRLDRLAALLYGVDPDLELPLLAPGSATPRP
jgi:hypothetical protein